MNCLCCYKQDGECPWDIIGVQLHGFNRTGDDLHYGCYWLLSISVYCSLDVKRKLGATLSTVSPNYFCDVSATIKAQSDCSSTELQQIRSWALQGCQ